MSVQGTILKGVSGGAFFAIVSVVVMFIQLRLVVDYLPLNLAGTWLLFVSVGSYIAFFDLGLSPTIAREISFHLGTATHDNQQRNLSIANLLATSNFLFRFLAIAVFVLAVLIGGYLVYSGTSQVQYSQVAWAWLIFSGGAALNLWASSPFAALYGLGYLGTERLIRSASLIMGLILTAIFLYADFGIVGLASAWAIQGILARLAAKQILLRRCPEVFSVHSKADMQLAKSIILPSLKWAAMGFGAILILQTDNVIIAAMLGTAYIPGYEAVAKIAITAMSIALLLVSATSPQISKAYAEKDRALVMLLLSQSIRLSVAVVVFLVAFVAVFGDTIIELWLGSGKFVGFPILWTLLIMVLLEAHHVAMATATLATGHMVFAKPALIAGLLNLIISVMLAPILGLWGVAMGTLIAQLLTNNWYAPYVTLKHFNLTLSDHIKTVLIPTFSLLIILLATNFATKRLLIDWGGVGQISIAFVLSILIGALVSYPFVLTKDERHVVNKYLSFVYRK